MHPRYLWGPTFVVLGMIILGACGLLAMHPAQVNSDDVLTLQELAEEGTLDRHSVTKSLMKTFRQEITSRAIGGCVACAVVLVIPMRSPTLAWILRPMIFMIAMYVTEMIRDVYRGNIEQLFTKISVVGGLVAMSVILFKAFAKSIDCNSKVRACSVWLDHTQRLPLVEDDPDSIDRLKHFQQVANGAPRAAT